MADVSKRFGIPMTSLVAANNLQSRQASEGEAVTTLEVGRLLNRLGDPAMVVERERQRLADAGGDLERLVHDLLGVGQRLHVGDRVDRNADLADFSACLR